MADSNRLPDFLVIGAEKAGTTWLHSQLRGHGQIFMPETKEIHYFNKWDSRLHLRDNYTVQEDDWYKQVFKRAGPRQRIGEVTPLYLCDAKAPERIAHTLSQAKFIAILRDPTARAYSHYWMARRREHEERSFEEVVAARDPAIIERGLYGSQISRWQKCVNDDALLILLYEEVFADPNTALGKIADFLDVDPAGFPSNEKRKVHGARRFRFPGLQNRAINFARYLQERPALKPIAKALKSSGLYGAFRKLNEAEEDYPPLDPALQAQLDGYYKADRELLTELTGLDLGSWSTDAPKNDIEAD